MISRYSQSDCSHHSSTQWKPWDALTTPKHMIHVATDRDGFGLFIGFV